MLKGESQCPNCLDPYKRYKDLGTRLPTLEELKNHDMDEINKAIINKAIDVRIEAMLREWGIKPLTRKERSEGEIWAKLMETVPAFYAADYNAKRKQVRAKKAHERRGKKVAETGDTKHWLHGNHKLRRAKKPK